MDKKKQIYQTITDYWMLFRDYIDEPPKTEQGWNELRVKFDEVSMKHMDESIEGEFALGIAQAFHKYITKRSHE